LPENVFVKLKQRGLIKISGDDRHHFLQGLISNDVKLLNSQASIYACLLTPNGKFLFDFFVLQDEHHLILDCEGGARAEDLAHRLRIYKLRSKVAIDVIPEQDIYAIFSPSAPSHSYPDPRHPDMGARSLIKPEETTEADFNIWDEYRIRLNIPDGSRDMEVEKSTLMECGIDRLQGISWDKGCYMGQELTARMKYRGLVKKSLHAIEFPSGECPPPFSPLTSNDKNIGEMRSSCGAIGLALLRHEYLDDPSGLPFTLLKKSKTV